MPKAAINKTRTERELTSIKNNGNKHAQGGNMLNKIAKIIGIGVLIMSSNILKADTNLVEVINEDSYIEVITGRKGIILPEDLSNPNNVALWDEYDPYIKCIGIKLNFPEEIIQKCEDERWKIRDENKIRELEEIVSTEEKFHAWCDRQEKKYSCGMHHIYAYILKKVNEKNYLISLDFCEQVALGSIIECIYYKGATRCMNGLYPNTMGGRYLKNFGFKW